MSSKSRNPKPPAARTILTTEDQALFDEAWQLFRKHHGQTLDKVSISDIFLDSQAVDMASNKFHKTHY